MTTWQNWAGNQIARGLTPSRAIVSNDDVVEVVKKARREKNRIKVVGTGHSFSGIARPEEVVVSLDWKSTRLNSSHEWISRMPSSA